MTNIVYNACYGGFGLSEAAMCRYFEIKGAPVTVVAESDSYRRLGIVSYVAADGTVMNQEIARHDLVLAQVVEELGDGANGHYAKLRITEVASGTLYRIDEYDGFESVMTSDDYGWTIAP